MQWHERRAGEVVIVDLDGGLTPAPGEIQLRQVIRGVLDRGGSSILLNLAKVKSMDSAGVGDLVAALSLAESHGASVKLLNLTSKIRDLLQFTQLISVFDSYHDESEAVASFE